MELCDDDDDDDAAPFALVVVDEAHHVYGDPLLKEAVEASVASSTRRLLLSDASQAARQRHAAYPPGPCHEATLTEVVRCSRRIVAGAMAFQLGGDQKLLTASCQDDAGPPLKSFLFDAGADRFEAYAAFCRKALEHVRDAFPRARLDDRIAVAVPDAAFRDALLARRPFPAFETKTAAEASARLPGVSDDGSKEWLLVDTVDHLDGLERLVVVCCGLDKKIDDAAPDTAARRSTLYRAVTRAHLMVVVVNEFARRRADVETRVGQVVERGRMIVRRRRRVLGALDF